MNEPMFGPFGKIHKLVVKMFDTRRVPERVVGDDSFRDWSPTPLAKPNRQERRKARKVTR